MKIVAFIGFINTKTKNNYRTVYKNEKKTFHFFNIHINVHITSLQSDLNYDIFYTPVRVRRKPLFL